jgi:hypothetical protein
MSSMAIEQGPKSKDTFVGRNELTSPSMTMPGCVVSDADSAV